MGAPCRVRPPQEHHFAFDHCYGPDTRQSEVFEGLGAGMLTEALEGFNGTIFTYGQTGARGRRRSAMTARILQCTPSLRATHSTMH